MSLQKRMPFFVLAFVLINVMIIIAAGFMMPLWSDFVAKIGGDVRTAGKAILIFSMVIGIFTCVAGYIESRLKQDYIFMVGSQLLMCMGYFGYFFVHHPYQLYLVQVVLGIGGAFQSPILCALYQSCIPKERTSFYWGVWNGCYQVAMGIGALSSAYLLHHFNYQAMFSGMFGVSLVCLFLVVFVMHRWVARKPLSSISKPLE